MALGRAQRRHSGKVKQESRNIKLATKRARDKKKAESARIAGLIRATRFSQLKAMRNDELADQLKIYKLVLKRTGFSVTQKDRPGYIVQVQALMAEEDGAAANNIEDGDSGVEGRGVHRRARTATGSIGQKKKQKVVVNQWKGYEWDKDQEFQVLCLAGKMIADGKDIDGQKRKAGTLLYKVVWSDYPLDAASWEEVKDIGSDLIDEYEAGLKEQAAADAALEGDGDEEGGGEEGDGGADCAGGEPMEEGDDGAADEPEQEGGDDDDDNDDHIEAPRQVASILRHCVFAGAQKGSLCNVNISQHLRQICRRHDFRWLLHSLRAVVGVREGARHFARGYARTAKGKNMSSYLPAE